MSDLLRILAILGLVAANAFFVGEYAVVTARRSRLAQRVEAGSRGAAAALRLMDDPVRVISTVQIGITAIGILTGAIGEPLVRDLLGGDLPSWLSFLVAFAIVTYVTVVLGERSAPGFPIAGHGRLRGSCSRSSDAGRRSATA